MIPHRRGATTLAAVLTAASLLASCTASDGDAGEKGSAPPSSTPSERTMSKAPDPAAGARLEAAVENLIRANTGRVELVAPFGSDMTIRESGSYQLEPVAFDLVRVMESPEGSIRIAYRGIGQRAWARLESPGATSGGEPGWACWVDIETLKSAPGAPAALVEAPTGQPPAALIAASYALGERSIDGGRVEGTTDLASSLSLVSGKLLLASGIDPQADDTITATFDLEGEVLSGFQVAFADMPPAIEAAGGNLSKELQGLEDLDEGIDVRFTVLGEPVAVRPPAAAEVMSLEDGQDFAAAMEACGR